METILMQLARVFPPSKTELAPFLSLTEAALSVNMRNMRATSLPASLL